MAFIIYKITNKINDKLYIGQTTSSLARRKAQYKWCVDRYIRGILNVGTVIIPAMAKHGIDNFEFEIIKECSSLDELNSCEIEYIKQYDCLVPKGYNIEMGGKNSPVSEETKKKISEAQLGSKNHRFGKKNSEAHNAIIRESSTGRTLSAESRKKISDALIGKPRSQETKDKMSKSLKGKPKLKLRKLSAEQEKEIYHKYMNGDISQKDLALQYNVGATTIGRVIKRNKI